MSELATKDDMKSERISDFRFDSRGKATKFVGNEMNYISKVIDAETWSSTYCSEQSWARSLEIAFARRWGMKYAVAMNSGTSTLHACLVASGVKAGDEVISPALTVVMDTTATLHANAVPVYADIREDTWTIDPEDVKRKITDKTKAIIVVQLLYLFGSFGSFLVCFFHLRRLHLGFQFSFFGF